MSWFNILFYWFMGMKEKRIEKVFIPDIGIIDVELEDNQYIENVEVKYED